MYCRLITVLAAVIILLCTSGYAATVNVPQDATTIQAGIDIASSGDTVLVSPGIYFERISFKGKNLVVASRYISDSDTSHISSTVIDGDTSVNPVVNDTGSVVRFVNEEDSTAELVGFTIRNGVGTAGKGGGIYCEGDFGNAPLISHCRIVDNQAVNGGSGLYIARATMTLDSCHVTGAGPSLIYAKGCVITARDCSLLPESGKALQVEDRCHLFLIHSVATGDIHLGSSYESSISIADNSTFGGGILGNNCRIDISDSRLEDADWLVSGCIITMQRDSISNCSIVAYEGPLSISLCVFQNSRLLTESIAANIDSTVFGGRLTLEDYVGGSYVCTNSTLLLDTSLILDERTWFTFTNCLVAMNDELAFQSQDWSESAPHVTLQCCNIFGTPASGWISADSVILDTSLVTFFNPRFCDAPSGDYHLAGNSPCLPDNHPCGVLVGALGEGCGPQIFVHYVDTTGSDITGNGTEEQPYRTIQHAIDVSLDGDSVIVNRGQYPERISFLGKNIVVASTYAHDSDSMSIYQTIIDGDTALSPLVGDTGSVVRLVNGEDSSAVLTGFTVQHGIGTNGYGGGVLVVEANPTIEHCRIVDNSASVQGGGIYANMCELEIYACAVVGNIGYGIAAGQTGKLGVIGSRVAGNEGVGIYFRSVGTGDNWATLKEDTVSGNTGDGISVSFAARNNISHCVIESNGGKGITTLGYQGMKTALAQKQDYIATHITGCVIDSNGGRGVYISDNMYAIDSCVISNNLDGGIDIQADAHLWMSNSQIVGNVSTDGGGIRQLEVGYTRSVTNCVFAHNSATKGGAIYVGVLGGTELANCTFYANAASEGSSIYSHNSIDGGLLHLEECIVAGGIDGAALEFANPSYGALEITCTDISGNEGGNWTGRIAGMDTVNGNMELDPLFCDADNGDYTLRSSSPCVPENNSCEVWIGAVDSIGCENAAPVISSPDSATAIEDSAFVYVATADDPDGPSLVFTFEDYPDWLTADADSIFGTPHFGDTNTSFIVIASDGFASDTLVVSLAVQQTTPVVTSLLVDGAAPALHVAGDAPEVCWSFSDPAIVQDSFKIAFGTDEDWEYAEMWNPSPFGSPDTCLEYAGAPLQDGATYYVHVQARNGMKWSPWYEESFRMNTPPGMDLVKMPSDSEKVKNHPELCLGTYADPEGDTVFYSIDIYRDAAATDTLSCYSFASTETDTTCWIVDMTFEPGRWYWCRAFACDGYEYYRNQVVDSFFTACCGWYTGGFTGNIDCNPDGKMNLADITELIDHVYLSKDPLCCEENGNVDGDVEGKINLADITALIDHIYLSKKPTAACS